MSTPSKTASLIWLIWSCCWAVFWFVMGLFRLGPGWIAVPVSLVLGLAPILVADDQPQQMVLVPPQRQRSPYRW
jgi:hypothetical protein